MVIISDLPHVCQAGEDERLRWIKSKCDNVFSVLVGQPEGFLDLKVLPQRLLIVAHLNHERNVKGFLQPPGRIASYRSNLDGEIIRFIDFLIEVEIWQW